MDELVQNTYIGVRFKENYDDKNYDSKLFYYEANDQFKDVRKGDYLIVQTRYGIVLGMVDNVLHAERNEIDSPVAISNKIIQKVNYENWYDVKNREEEQKQLKTKLDNMLNMVAEYNKYDILVDTFPEAKDLVNRYKQISKEIN